jgi:uncharacterized protein (TIGR03437 family)
MIRITFFLAFFCLGLHAQFDSLQTTDDGSVLLFGSAWHLAGTDDSGSSRIFRWDATRFSQVSKPSTGQFLSPSFTSAPFLSGDGKISGYSVVAGCSTGCPSLKPTLVLNGAAAPASLTPSINAFLSRNGRYLASGNTVADLSTGATQNLPSGLPVGGRYGIGNNGTVLMYIVHQVFIISSMDLTLSTKPGLVIVNAPVVLNAVISAAENRVVYEIWGDTAAVRDQLWSYDVASGQATKLADIPLGTNLGISQFQPSISNDGSRLLYRRPRAGGGFEVVLLDFNTGATTTLAQILPSASNLVISGDGRSAWVHRVDGKLVRIAIDTSQVSEIPGRHAWMAQQAGGLVAGSYHHLYGGGFAPDDTSGPVGDITVDLTGAPFPIVGAGTRELDVQIPWNGPSSGQFPLTLHSSSSPFESVLALDAEIFAPTFERTGMPTDPRRDIIVAHEDFHGVVTTADPAIPGEIVHVYMTGLGGTQPTPPTGSPTPFLAQANIRPVCSVAPQLENSHPAAVTFAGLAPGMIGIYQVDISIPTDVPPGDNLLSCADQVPGLGIAGDLGSLPIGKTPQQQASCADCLRE